MVGWYHRLDMSLSWLRELVIDGVTWRAAVHGVTKSWTWLSNWTEPRQILLRCSPRVQWIKSFFSQAAGNRHYSWLALRTRESSVFRPLQSLFDVLPSGVFSQACADHAFAHYSRREPVQGSTTVCLRSCLFSDSLSVLWIQAALAFYSGLYVPSSWSLWPHFPFPLLSLDTLKSISWEIVGFISSVSYLSWFKAFCLFFVVDLFWLFQFRR